MLSAAKGHDEVLQVLLANKSPVNAKNRKGETATVLADRGHHAATVALLKKHGGIVPDKKKPALSTSQKLAALNKSTDGVYKNWSPLMIAVWRGQDDVVSVLLRKGAGTSEVDKEGHTPLTRAAMQGHDSIIKQLISAGADVNTVAAEGKTALMWAAIHGQDSAIKVLLNSGARINTLDQKGRSALRLALENQQESTSLLLLQKGARPSNRMVQDRNDLMLATASMPPHVIVRILEAGGDGSLLNAAGHDALWFAIDSRRVDIVELLLTARNTNIKEVDSEGMSLLHKAAEVDAAAIITLLIGSGAPVDIKAPDGNTPLMIAASRGYPEAIRALVNHGANVNNQNNVGNTPLILAVLADNAEAVGLLLDSGADMHIRNDKREKAINLAELNANENIIEMLQSHSKNSKMFGLF
jgi:ankyrin repeat protein